MSRELPIFPLPLVLFPGAPLPLHIFEERYKLMVGTLVRGDKLFGVNFIEPEPGRSESESARRVGCTAEILLMAPLEGGRMNIMNVGRERYRITEYTAELPYHVAAVEFFQDEPEFDEEVDQLAGLVRGQIEHLSEVANKLNGSPLFEEALPAAPAAVSFLAAAVLPIENAVKQELLELTSTRRRLEREQIYLAEASRVFERRLLVKTIAPKNGHAGRVE